MHWDEANTVNHVQQGPAAKFGAIPVHCGANCDVIVSTHRLSSAACISFQSSSSGSQPTDSRTNPSGTLSPQRARRSADVCTPPKLVVGRMNLQPLMNFSAEFLSLKVTPRIIAKRSI